MAAWIRQVGDGVEITLKVVPGASRDRIVGPLGDALKVQVSAPPEKGRANRAVVALIARALGVGAKHVAVVRGESNARKTIRVQDCTIDAAASALCR